MTVIGVDGRTYKDQASADKAAARMAKAPKLDGSATTNNTTTTTPKTTTPTTSTTSTNKSSNTQWSATNYKDSDGYYSGTERNAATGGSEFGGSSKTSTQTSAQTPSSNYSTRPSDILIKGESEYDPNTGYYRASQTKQGGDTSGKQVGGQKTIYNSDQIRATWDKLPYEEQQKRLQASPGLKDELAKMGITIKTKPGATGETPTTPTTTGGDGWDYQDNSPERMKQIADNVNQFAQTDPYIFNNEDSFRKFFIDGKGRTPEQEAFLMDLYKNRKKYNELDNYTADNIGNMAVNGQIPDSYLTYLKNTNPDRYAAVMDAKARETDKIKDKASMDTISSMDGGTDYTSQTSTVIEWLKSQGLLVDKDGNLIDDRTENYASEEEKGYLKQIADLNATNLDIDNTVKHAYDDLVKAYPGATKATLMAMAQDMNADLLREKENNLVELTRLQGYVGYMQSERQERDTIGQNAINQLQKQYGMYYKYTPEGMSELAQAQYAATNVTLDQADNGTDTQKQMALKSVLDGYYEKYGSIIQRSEAQVINDVMALAKQKGISLSQALEDNFLSYLRQKPGYNALATGQSTAENKYNWSSYEGPDGKKHILRMNETTGQWEELDIGDALGDMADLDGLKSSNRDTRKQALFNLAQQADSPQVQAELIAAAMEGNYAGTCGAYANDINYAITGDNNGIFGNDVGQKEGVCDNTKWENIQAGDFVVFNYQKIPGVSRNTVPSWLGDTDLETWQDMYDHGHVGYVTGVDAQGNITMTHTKSKIATTSTFGKNTKLGQALYGSYTPQQGYDRTIPDVVYNSIGKALDNNDWKSIDNIAEKYNYKDTTSMINQYKKQYQDSILPVTEGMLKAVDQLIASTKNTSKEVRVATLGGEGSYVNSEGYSAYQTLKNQYALDKLTNMKVKLTPMSDKDVQLVAAASNAFMGDGYKYENDNYFRDLQNIRDSILASSPVLQKKYGYTNSWNGEAQYYDGENSKFTSTKPRGVLGQ